MRISKYNKKCMKNNDEFMKSIYQFHTVASVTKNHNLCTFGDIKIALIECYTLIVFWKEVAQSMYRNAWYFLLFILQSTASNMNKFVTIFIQS